MTDADKPVEYFNLRDLTPELMEEMFGPVGEFKPHWYYNKYGDQIEVVWKNVPARGEYVNKDVYLIRSIDTNEIIGVTAPGVLLRLEKEGVVCSVSRLDAIREKVGPIIDKLKVLRDTLGLYGCASLMDIIHDLKIIIEGDDNEEIGKD